MIKSIPDLIQSFETSASYRVWWSASLKPCMCDLVLYALFPCSVSHRFITCVPFSSRSLGMLFLHARSLRVGSEAY